MSGHSKWSTIKHQKGVKDAARGKLFSKLSRAISVAVSAGGNKPDTNYKLKVAIDQARSRNMPKENINRALKKGEKSAVLEEITYEGFGPSGIMVMIEVATDNRNRTGQEIKKIIDRGGGRLSGSGSVSFNFEPKGFLIVKKEDAQSQILKLIDIGVEDIEEIGDTIEVYVAASELKEAKDKIEELGFEVINHELIQKPKNNQIITDQSEASKALIFLENLEEHADVQNVFANLDIPEDTMKKIQE